MRLSKVKRDAVEFLMGRDSANPPFELWETLQALANLARDGDLGVVACTVVDAQDGNEGHHGIAFDLAPSERLLAALARSK